MNKPPVYTISPEECDRIVVETLKFYKNLQEGFDPTHPEDIKYNKKLKKSINFLLNYLGEPS